MARILAVDDDRDQLILFQAMLRKGGHETLLLQNPLNILTIIREVGPDLLITDIMMPGLTGGSVYEMVRDEYGKNLPILIVSGTKLRLKSALKDPLLGYLPKPIGEEALLNAVETLLLAAMERKGAG